MSYKNVTHKINKDGLNIIKSFEGLYLTAYTCPSGVITIGYGSTTFEGKPITRGMKITKEQAEAQLKKDVEKFEKHVNVYNKIYGFNNNQFSALVSFAYNVGSINGLTKNGTRKKTEIRDAMLLYVKSNGIVLKGLERRRKAEQQLFIKKE